MLDNFIYETHLGQRFDGLANGVFMNYSDLRDYEWNYDAINSRISRFYRAISNRKIPIQVACKSDSAAVTVKNKLLEMAETDIVAKLPGKIYVGEYYTQGFITSSSKGEYLKSKRLCEIELTLTSDNPAWYREQTYYFIPGGDGGTSYFGGYEYPYEYKYDYAFPLEGRRIVCDAVGSSAFKLLIYGPITDPAVFIGGHEYAVKGTIGSGETLLIDSVNKTITLTTARGNRINWFDKRKRESYIFEPIPSGQNIVGWTGSFGFDLTVIEERSEPRWT